MTGLAYALSPKTIIRASGGIYYSDATDTGGYTAGFTSSPSFSSPDNYTPVYNWGTAGFPQNYSLPPQISPSFQNGQSITWLLAQGTRLPQILTWTVAIQREVLKNLALDVSYIGSHSTHLSAGSSFDYVNDSYLSLGSLLLQPAGSAAAAAANVPLPFPTFSSLNVHTVAQALMPYPQYTSVGTGSENDPVGSARFNSLQVKATKRYSNGTHAAHLLYVDEEHEHAGKRPVHARAANCLQRRFPAIHFCIQLELRVTVRAEEEISAVEQPGGEVAGGRLEHRRLRTRAIALA